VRSLLQGELRGEAGRLRLEAWLVDGPTRRVLWAGGYDLRPGDLRDVRDAIVRGVTKRLGGRERPPARVIVAASPHAAEAHEAYLQGLEELEDTDDPLARGRAAEAFERAVTLDPGNALAWAGRARALWWRYDREDDRALLALADQASKEAVRLSPGLVQARLVRAQILRSTGHTPEAITEVEEARRLNPAYDGSLLQLALIHRKLGDYDRAIACMRELTRLRPGYWRTWNDLGNVYLRHGNHAAAREAYRRAIDLAPGRNRPRESLANVEILEGRYAAALDLYRHLPQPVLDAALASNIATAYFFSKDLANARRYYLLAVSLEPRDAVLRVNLGDCYARLGQRASARAQYREAVGLTEEALHSEPDNMGLRAQLIVQRAKAGDCEGARAEFEARGAGIPDTDLEVLRDLAKAHALCGDRVRALAAIRRAIVDLGAPGRLFGDEDEFVSLRQDAEFRALVARNNP
jgi:Flp pilus assembly protein TadD